MKPEASFGKRLAAFLVDLLLIGALSSLFLLFRLWYAAALVAFCYFTVFEGSPMQATPGKKLFGIAVSGENGLPVSFGTALLRTLCKMISGAAFGVGFLMAAFREDGRTLHDLLASTRVMEVMPASDPSVSRFPGPGNPQIIGITGEYAGKSIPLTARGIMMGRDRVACQIVFSSASERVSRHHRAINYMPQTRMIVLNDVGSTCGVFVGEGTRVERGKPVALQSGERFYLGDSSNMFETRI